MTKNNSTTKKCFIIAVIAMMTLAACTKLEDTAPPRKITFETATYRPQTKADNDTVPAAGSIMREFASFKCKAFLHADSVGSYFTTQDMFGANGETISAYDGSNSITTNSALVAYWAPSHDYYWPKGSRSYINFVGWYDKKGTAPTEATEESLKWENYTVLTDDNLLFADEAWHFKATPNAEYHKDGGVTKGVPMMFHHALAKLCIKAAVADTTKANVTGGEGLGKTKWEVTLSNISLAGVYNQGTLALTNGDPANDPEPQSDATTKAWSGSWTPVGNAASIAMGNVDAPLQTTAVDVLEMQTVMPQAVTSDMILSFDYKIVTKFNNEQYAQEKIHADINLSTIADHIANWDMNKKITYTITINPETTTIKIDPAMVDWLTDSAVYPNPNQNNGN